MTTLLIVLVILLIVAAIPGTLYGPLILAQIEMKYYIPLGFTLEPTQGYISTITGPGGKAIAYYANIVNGDTEIIVDRTTGILYPGPEYQQKNPAGYTDYQRRKKGWLHRKGIVYMGLPFIAKRRRWIQQWNDYAKNPNGIESESSFVPRRVVMDSLPFRYMTAIIQDGLETAGVDRKPDGTIDKEKGQVALVTLRSTVTFEITDANQAQFMTDDYLEQGEAYYNSVRRDQVAQKTIIQVITGQHELNEDSFGEDVKIQVNETIGSNPGLKVLCGLKIIAVNFISIATSGQNRQEVLEALESVTIAIARAEALRQDSQGQADAMVNLARAEAEKKRLLGDGDGYALLKLVESGKGITPELVEFRKAEALEKTRVTTLLNSTGAPPQVLVGAGLTASATTPSQSNP